MTTVAINIDTMREKIGALKKELEARSPQMRILCHEIHSNLKQDTELVTLLSEEEIQTIVTSLGVVTQREVLFASTKTKTGKKALSKIGEDDL